MHTLFAGMAVPLPFDTPLAQRLNDSIALRLQAISFFLLVLLLCTLIVWGLWNYVRRDLQFLPRLTFGKALAGVVLWGLLCFIVLTMISGARELMTPGAWKKDGFTYKLASEQATSEDPVEVRKRHLEQLRTVLWRFAATHYGRFPVGSELHEIPDDMWLAPDGAGLRYQYIPGLSASKAADLLLYEPELEPSRRFAILTNGEIVSKSSAEILAQRPKGAQP
jgi:hypothetical protein